MIVRNWRTLGAFIIALPLLTGCFEDSKQEILANAGGISDKAALTEALGKPGDVAKLEPLETWTYRASNGTVEFVIAGSTVTMRKTGDKSE